MTFDGQAVKYHLDMTNPACGDGTGEYRTIITWKFSPMEAEVIDGRYVVTKASGEGIASNTSRDPGTCRAHDGGSVGEFEVARG
ncbi:MAG: hypothetical protein Q4G35_09210 [Propionibacteriaceae bacterium]|nr:hypothetical protein [Propionibacteriaceae bacterium]